MVTYTLKYPGFKNLHLYQHGIAYTGVKAYSEP